MRIIFVGLHSKPDMRPLDILTKTGKLINRIIRELNTDIDIVKSNLFDVEYMPNKIEFDALISRWYWTHLPVEDDIIVLLGAMTHKEFRYINKNIIKIAHPASKRSHIDMDEYVSYVAAKIKQLTKQNEL